MSYIGNKNSVALYDAYTKGQTDDFLDDRYIKEVADDRFFTSRRNLLINGGFDVWQRGTSGFSGGGYSADRWSSRSSSNVGGTQNISKGFVPRIGNYLIMNTSGATSSWYIGQKIEDVTIVSDATITSTFSIQNDETTEIRTVVVQNFGSGAGASAQNVIYVPYEEVASGDQTITFNVDIPTIDGKTIDGDDNYLEIRIEIRGVGDTPIPDGTYRIFTAQVEEGSVATPFEKRNITEELTLCRRYYDKTVPDGTYRNMVAYILNAGEIGFIHFNFNTEMRDIPAVTLISFDGTVGSVTGLGDANFPGLVFSMGERSCLAGYSDTTDRQRVLYFHYIADAEL